MHMGEFGVDTRIATFKILQEQASASEALGKFRQASDSSTRSISYIILTSSPLHWVQLEPSRTLLSTPSPGIMQQTRPRSSFTASLGALRLNRQTTCAPEPPRGTEYGDGRRRLREMQCHLHWRYSRFGGNVQMLHL
ncbi:hypothetical protein AcW1_006126 [Taiwanofungus camphoratus]|nr:hypothetical protein AcW1_006126 [Antrodia cinnamomea]